MSDTEDNNGNDNNDDLNPGLDQEHMSELVEHLKSVDDEDREGVLASEESFHLWLTSHPGLRQMIVPETISEVVPSILNALRVMFGLDKR